MKVKVWNDSTHDWTETFKGDKITIKAKEHIEMEESEAVEFKGQYSGFHLLANGTQDPKTMKMIRIEKPKHTPEEEEGMEIFPCQACRKVFTTEELLLKHSDKEHAAQVVVDPVAEKEMKSKKSYKFGSTFEEA